MLDPVLEKRFIRQARGLVLQLGDKEVKTLRICTCGMLLHISRPSYFR